MTLTFTAISWDQVLQALRGHPPGTVLRLSKHFLSHPEDNKARRSLGLPMGQSADFRWIVGNCRGLHVRDFGSHYEAHLDQVDPACNLIEHLRQDTPGTYIAGAAALGGLLGILLGGSKDSVLAGAAIGAAIGATTLPTQNSDSECCAND